MELEALIEARPTRRDQVGAWYGELLEAAGNAGVSVSALAKRLGCSRETLYSWRRRLTPAPPADAGAPARQLVRVQVAPSPPAAGPDRLEVRLRSGRTVLVPAAFDPATLTAVVEALEQC